MKQLENIFRTIFCLVAFLFASTALAAQELQTSALDSIDISLITCTPHEEVYSLYGHTAIRVNDHRQTVRQHDGRVAKGQDLVFNYGIFNQQKPLFALRFMFGLTDYELGVASFDGFCNYYRRWGSRVSEQVVNLTNGEKAQLLQALSDNARPENRVYRYNVLYNNCSTRARDIIIGNIEGRVSYKPHPDDYSPSYRQMIHEKTAGHPWAAFGNDMLLGVKADLRTTLEEQQFLPDHLEYDFARAVIHRPGEVVPLVSETHEIVAPGLQKIEPEFPLTPTQCAIVLLVLSLLVFALEWHRRQTLVGWDVLLMLACGLAGCIVMLMFFSLHPTTSTNLLLLLLNPLPLLYIPAVARRRRTHYWNVLLSLIVLFFIGGLWQDYAEGMEILALCLLIRYWSHLRHDK